MKNKLLIAAASLFVFAVLLHNFEKPVLAQIRAAFIKNIDERGRAPYMTTAICQPDSGSNFCSGTFAVIPPNKRFVVEYANGAYLIRNAEIDSAALNSGSTPRLVLDPHLTGSSGFFNSYLISMQLLAYYEPGDAPSVLVISNAGNVQPSGSVTLSGYLVDLTQ
jgi:hypothetical protein